jgi:polysaccharide biosynthesis transport protein
MIDLENTLALPQSQNAMMQGAPSSSLNRIHEASAKFQRYKILLRRRWWFLLLTASIGVCIQAIRIATQPEMHRSLAKLMAGGRVVAGGSMDANWQEQLTDFYGTIIEMLQSTQIKSRAFERVRTLQPDLKQHSVEVSVVQNRGSSIFNVMAVGSDPKFTQVFLDALIDEFTESRQEMRNQGVDRALNTFTENMVKRGKELQDRTDKLEAFKKANDRVVVTEGRNVASAALQALNLKRDLYFTQLKELEVNLMDENVDKAMLDRERGATSAAAKGADVSGSSGTATAATAAALGLTTSERDYLETKKRLLELRNERQKKLRSFKAAHPEVMILDESIDSEEVLLKNFNDEIVKEMRIFQTNLQRQIQALDEQIKLKEREALDLGAKLAELDKLESDYTASKRAYDEMFERTTKFTELQSIQTDYVAIQERAGKAVKDIADWKMPLAVGLLGGILCGLVILVLFDRLDDRMNSFSEFQGLFPAEAVLGQIPEQRQRGDVALLRPNDDRHLYAEAFRNIRSSILFKNWQGRAPKTILVTSAVPNEGKTTVTSNLAVTMATAGARVLLADCDLRRGGVSELFKLPVSPGLSEVLRGKLHWRDAVQETGIRGLDLLARGEVFDQTSEMLLSRTAEEMLREMGDEYDYVIFDSAPVLVADDTASFSPKLDTVLFVVRMSSTMARLTGKALDLLYERQVNIGGVILNRSTTNLKEYTYYNYASYYYAPVQKKPEGTQQPPPVPTSANG